jgi:putative transposase
MPNHWHFVVWPRQDGELTAYFRWLSLTHAMRWRVAHRTVGWGHLYQGRFKNFPIQRDEHLQVACRYVERNALSSGLVKRAENWRYSSLWSRANGSDEQKAMLAEWPLGRPPDWTALVNRPMTEKELARYEMSLKRLRPYGDEGWITTTAGRLGIEHTLRREGRPRKEPASDGDEN